MAEKPKRKWWKWIAYPVGAVVVLYGIATALVNLNSLQKPASFPHTRAATAASLGMDPKEYFEGSGWEKYPNSDEPTCKSDEGETMSHLACIVISKSQYVGCGIWYDPYCVSLQAPSYLLSQPERLGRVVESLVRPCKYLADPKGSPWMNVPEMDREAYKEIFKYEWEKALCDTHPDRYPGRVVLTFYGEEPSDENGVMQIVKPDDDW